MAQLAKCVTHSIILRKAIMNMLKRVNKNMVMKTLTMMIKLTMKNTMMRLAQFPIMIMRINGTLTNIIFQDHTITTRDLLNQVLQVPLVNT